MSLLSESVALLNAGLRAAGGEDVTYIRRGQTIERLGAVRAAVKQEDYGEGIVTISARDHDWIVLAAELVMGGQVITPERGDVIELRVGNVVRTFTVLPRAGDRVSRPTDPTETQLRIFTVEGRARTE